MWVNAHPEPDRRRTAKSCTRSVCGRSRTSTSSVHHSNLRILVDIQRWVSPRIEYLLSSWDLMKAFKMLPLFGSVEA